ncbi:MAG TPA: ubiquinol-cytochrome C chaperone family protein [Terriglobia bacterium]|nr:ubiquinol-cytochrome C chaperone family protein [Terriglobia bacterium]
MLFLRRFLRDDQLERAAAAIYAGFAGQARQPVFYLGFGVPDSVDGRFEMVALHAFLVFRRLKGEGAEIERLTQATYDTMFKEMDLALRELGAADLGVGRRIKHMTEALNGRIQIYEQALVAGDADALKAALRRNLYGTVEIDEPRLGAMAAYIREVAQELGAQETAQLAAGKIRFPAPEKLIS